MRVVRVGRSTRRRDRRGAPRGAVGVRRRPRLPRALPRTAAAHRDPAARRHARHRARTGRARLLGATPAPEGPRGDAVAGARSRVAGTDERRRRSLRASDRLRRCRNCRVRARRTRVLLPRAERADPGGAPRHRGGDGGRPRAVAAADRPRRASRLPARAAWSCGRSAALRRGPADVPAPGGPNRGVAPSHVDPGRHRRRRRRRGRHRLRPDDREADCERRDARGGARPARSGARRDGGRSA